MFRLGILLFLVTINCANAQTKQYYVRKNTLVEIAINVEEETVLVRIPLSKYQEKFPIAGSPDPVQRGITFADYNFDGIKDFAVSVADAGSGAYTIYDIFIYNPLNKSYHQLALPAVDALNCVYFCNIRLNAKTKTLHSECRGGAKWHQDVFKFAKSGKLYLVK